MFEHISECARVGHHVFQYLTQGQPREIWDGLPDARVCENCGYWQIEREGTWYTMTPEERVAYELMYSVEAPK